MGKQLWGRCDTFPFSFGIRTLDVFVRRAPGALLLRSNPNPRIGDMLFSFLQSDEDRTDAVWVGKCPKTFGPFPDVPEMSLIELKNQMGRPDLVLFAYADAGDVVGLISFLGYLSTSGVPGMVLDLSRDGVPWSIHRKFSHVVRFSVQDDRLVGFLEESGKRSRHCVTVPFGK